MTGSTPSLRPNGGRRSRSNSCLHRLPAGLGISQETLDGLPHLPDGSFGLGVGRVKAEGAALLPVQPRAFQQRLVHAPLGRVPVKAEILLSGMLEHRLDQVRRAAAAEEDRERRLMSSLRQRGVELYTSSQARESRSLSSRCEERVMGLP